MEYLDEIQNKKINQLEKLDPYLMLRLNPRTKVVASIQGKLSASYSLEELRRNAYDIGKEFLNEYKELFGNINIEEELVEGGIIPEKIGTFHLDFQQVYQNIPVHGASIFIYFSSERRISAIHCKIEPRMNISIECKVPIEEAIENAINHAKEMEEDLILLKDQKPEKIIYSIDNEYRLCWRIELNGEHQPKPTSWVYFIDCITGKIAYRFNNLDYGTATRGDGIGYWSNGGEDGQGKVNSYKPNTGNFQLKDVIRSESIEWGNSGPIIIINDCNAGDDDYPSISEDNDNNWEDLTIDPKHLNQGAEVDAVRYAGEVLDYFHYSHECNSYDKADHDLTIDVHFKENYGGGFWSRGFQKVRLGDGDKELPSDPGALPNCYDYCCTNDWLAHEITHAYTQHLCRIDNDGKEESGALCEAFSDCFAAFINGDWLIFENREGLYRQYAIADRNMMDPTNNNTTYSMDPIENAVIAGHQPDHYNNRKIDLTDRFNGEYNKYVNCGIINHAIYLMVVGGTHRLSGVNVISIGQIAVESMLFHVIDGRLNSTANFLEFREIMLISCQNLYPEDLENLLSVKAAFKAVGIGSDLYIRDTINDVGEEPNPLGVSCRSPDIIIQNSLINNPEVALSDPNQDYLGPNVIFGQDNYIYIRIRNGGNHPDDAEIDVYFSPGTTFATPSAWTYVGHLREFNIIPGEFRVSQPLIFTEEMIPEPGHYCFIAVVRSALDPAPDYNLIDSIDDFHNYIQYSNNYAWRNFEVENDVVPGAPVWMHVIIQGLPNAHMRTDIEIDLTDIPAESEFEITMPEIMIRGVNYTEISQNKPVKKVILNKNIGLRPKILHSRIRIKKDEKKFQITPQNIGVFERLPLKPGSKIKAGIMIKLPEKVKKKEFVFSIKQKVSKKTIGQMNYMLRIK
jgi:thermolysin